MKTLLIVSAGIEACHGIQRAKAMGLKVLVSDANPDAPGFAVADGHFIASTYDAGATAQAAQAYAREHGPIDAVMTIGADVPVTVASVAERLKLPGISMASATLATDKLAMKRRFQEAGVPIPWFTEVRDRETLRDIVATRGDRLVLKPADSRGSRGVQRLWLAGDFDAALALALSHSPSGRAMVEEYLDGPQVSTESIVSQGCCFTPGFSDRNYEMLDAYAPFFVENGGDLPSRLPQAIQDEIRHVVGRAAEALDIVNGTVKGDIVVTDGKVRVIELAARLSGGYFCSREIPLNTGVDFVGLAIRIALGESVREEEATPKFQRSVVQRYAFPTPGRVTEIAGEEDARAVPGIEEVLVSAKIGDMMRDPCDSNCSAAMVLATGETHDAALAACHEALSRLRIETVPA